MSSSFSFARRLPSPLAVVVAPVALALGSTYVMDSRSMLHSHGIVPLLRWSMDAEPSHEWAIRLSKWGLCPKDTQQDAPSLQSRMWNRWITNPIGLAAGFDKHGEAVDALFRLGFGLVEVGSVTPQPQPGNPRPRMFRLEEDQAVINRYGFNSQGHATVLGRLVKRQQGQYPHQLLGVNLGKNKSSPADSNQDYVDGMRVFGPHADYVVVNISSPNTPGLRHLQQKEVFERLIKEVLAERDQSAPHCPVLFKIAPDVTPTELEAIATLSLRYNVDGLILTNTTVERPPALTSPSRHEQGGLSGRPLKHLSRRRVAECYNITQGRVLLIGCGGIETGEDVVAMMEAGASVVQAYTAIAYAGPGWVRRVKDELTAVCKERKLEHVQALVGSRYADYL